MINKNDFWNKYKSCEIYNISDLPSKIQKSIEIAKNERRKAYAPYSHYGVGAVIVTEAGRNIPAANSETCNIDSICAEAGAIDDWTKITHEDPTTHELIREKIIYVVVVGSPFSSQEIEPRPDMYVTPCGRCRQRLYEHCDGDTIIVGCNETLDKARVCKLGDLLPFAYTPQNLK